MKHKPTPPQPPAPRPYLSHVPWAGFARGDAPRGEPMPACPNARCRRAKQCIAAHGNVFCQRTHFSLAEKKKFSTAEKLEMARLFPPLAANAPLELRHERMLAIIEHRRAKTEAMTARWKAGEFDALYGPFRPRGALMKPPPRAYVEEGHPPSQQSGISGLQRAGASVK